MKFFFPDSHDYVDPKFDFVRDCSPPDRERHHHDVYAHEILDEVPYDGLLVSKSIVDGSPGKPGKYTVAQRHRLHREGVHRFFRVEGIETPDGEKFPIMGDCGAFSYIAEDVPPITVEEAIDFYEECGFTHGQSIDHIIPEYKPEWDSQGFFAADLLDRAKRRFDLTLKLAHEFFTAHRARNCAFEPIAVAQGWSPASYVDAVQQLTAMGYKFIALGGLVPLRTAQFMEVLRAVMPVVADDVRIHVLGVIRWEHLDEILDLGVHSFDSTSPLRQAFLDSKANYYAGETTRDAYAAVRVPQMDGNNRLKSRILAGELSVEEVRSAERRCLDGVRAFSRDPETVDFDELLSDLERYARWINPRSDPKGPSSVTLWERPWEKCQCRICREIGVEVVLFRGANRNRRRGFHNLYVAYHRLQAAIRGRLQEASSRS